MYDDYSGDSGLSEEYWQHHHQGTNGMNEGTLVWITILFLVIGFIIWDVSSGDVTKPWWNGDQSMNVCEVDGASGSSCYTLVVTSNGQQITDLGFPNGTLVTSNTSCDYSKTLNLRYCDFDDQQGRQWEVQKQ